MTVSRLRSTEAITNSANQWPNLSAAYSAGGSPWNTYQFIGNGQDSINGQNYRVHRLECAVASPNSVTLTTSLSFSKAGYIDVIVVAGGGSGGYETSVQGGGGGAGGAIIKYDLYVEAATYSCTVGTGGQSQATSGTPAYNGGNSIFGPLIAIGGGAGGSTASNYVGSPGGSGGGHSWSGSASLGPVGVAGQGFAGGQRLGTATTCATGGGGFSSAGETIVISVTGKGLAGGSGFGTFFDGMYRAMCAGGGGGGYPGLGGAGGSVNGVVVGGNGGSSAAGNTPTSFGCGGGGGGSAGNNTAAQAGGQGSAGVILVRYKI